MNFAFDNTYIELPKQLFSKAVPTTVAAPTLVLFNEELAADLSLSVFGGGAEAEEHEQAQDQVQDQVAQILGGNVVPPGAASIAQAYCGHQFGHFTMLGDGRAILLGEHVAARGARYDIQLKGAGPTPYSRRGDGRAALGPMLREYLISEAMHALGVPSTRSLAVVATGERILRENYLKGAVLTRVAKSHLRVGTFQYAAAALPLADQKALADYAIARHYPQCQEAPNPYLALLDAVIESQASLIAKWQALGFVHGVMNTDNMSICGETIDYGPCAFIDAYDPGAVFSSIDQGGRYAYGNQPTIAGWNLTRLAEALLPLIAMAAGAQPAPQGPVDSASSSSPDASSSPASQDLALALANASIAQFSTRFNRYYLREFANKIGILDQPISGPMPSPSSSPSPSPNASLITELLALMADHALDFTYTFYALTQYARELLPPLDPLNPQAPDASQPPLPPYLSPLTQWIDKWQAQLKLEAAKNKKGNKDYWSDSYNIMKRSNPAIIPTNYRVEEALYQASFNDNYEPIKTLLSLLQNPYGYTQEQEALAAPAPKRPSHKPYRTFCGT